MMKRLILLVLLFCTVSLARAGVSTRVCLADGNTPLEYQDIMVGTKLTIIVYSDANGYWSGSLAIADANMNYGVLSAREPKIVGDWSGSHFEAAGNKATVYDWEESGIDGFDLYTGSTGREAGDWFIIDYNATDVGDCSVGFYDHSVSWNNPIYNIEFTHVRTRDFNGDTKVDFADFVVLASYWQETSCNDPNWCEGTDIDIDGNVDVNDLILFIDYWLEKTR